MRGQRSSIACGPADRPYHSFWLVWLLCLPLAARAELHHALKVRVSPEGHSLEVSDTITRSEGRSDALEFALHPELTPEVQTPGVRLSELPSRQSASNVASDRGAVQPKRYRIELPSGQTRFTLSYRGRIRHALQQQGEEYARGFRETPGMISAQGVFLAGRSFWYPQLDAAFLTFELTLRLPPDWYGMTQGERVLRDAGSEGVREQWRSTSPQEEIYLVAGPFTEYVQGTDEVQSLVLLREPDATLAQKYLDATDYYVRLYSDLIGAYPYRKFALVENFWETGYGMPSFTLLGPRVIRFPFILHSSYPHEILHNWWGNGVYVDYARGNWAEGLTSYLADHLIKEQHGQGSDYRRGVLQKYADYVLQQQDFPLTQFRSRHSASSEAVGYGKTLMLFHMLRRQLGDETFIAGLRALYAQYRFRVADFAAVQAVFSAVAEQPLDAFFAQWVRRAGAPGLRVSQARARPAAEGYRLSLELEQTPDEAAYALQVPVAVHLEGQAQAYQTDVVIDQRRTLLELKLPARPLRLDVDPEFDVFRRLHRNEIPPAISQAAGAERVLVLLPAEAPDALREAYELLARSWQTGERDKIEVRYDREFSRLPGDRAVWLFGWRNRFRPQLGQALADYAFEDRGEDVRIEQTILRPQAHAVVVVARQSADPDQALGWVATENPAALPGLGRKLPHYGRYSYLAFTGDEPSNVFKGQWPVIGSPMSVMVAQSDGATLLSAPAQLAPRKPLVSPQEPFSTRRLQRDIAVLADEALAGRGLGTPELDQAADYIAGQFRAAGLQPGGDGGSWLQAWQEPVEPLGRVVRLKNVVAVLPGSDPERAGESLVIGAHYDHLGRGEYVARAADRDKIHPGADDNASGVAVMLELARVLGCRPQPRSVVFVAFTGEEVGRLGSRHYVQHPGDYPINQVIAMVNLDTVGRLGKNPLTVFGAGSAEEWVHILRGAGYVTGVPITNVADDFGSGDQTSFIDAGVPAVQLFSGVHDDFHRPGDTPDKIDVPGLVKTAQVLRETVEYLAGRAQALRSTLGDGRENAIPAARETARQVSLGTVPDYAFSGGGVRIDEVRAGTPAEQAGLQKDDVIIAVNETPVQTLREYAQALRGLKPGDAIRIRFRRDHIEQAVTARLVAR